MSKVKKPKIVVVVGPTASGKTSLAVNLAKQFSGEIVSADSRQVYRGLDIGTAKVTEAEMQGIPHHLIDTADVNDVYTAADFKRDAVAAITDIIARNHLPIIAGGTFFYVDMLLSRITTPEIPPNEALRSELEQLSPGELYKKLQVADPDRAATIDQNNPRRLIRALEVWHVLGHVPKHVPIESPYDVLLIGLETDREDLRARISGRATKWLHQGFEHEIKTLLERGVTSERLNELGFEYKLGQQLVTSVITPTEFCEQFLAKNWQYAKRQLTWLKRDPTITWFDPTDLSAISTTVQQFLTEH